MTLTAQRLRYHHVCRVHGEWYSDHALSRCRQCAAERERERKRIEAQARRAGLVIPGEGDNVKVVDDPSGDFDPGALFPVLQFTQDLKAGNWPEGMKIKRGGVVSVVRQGKMVQL